MREQVELLEDDANAGALLVHIDARVGDVGVTQPNLAIVDLLQEVDALHERRLARAGGTQQCHRLMLVHVEGNVIQHDVVSEALEHIVDA